MREPTWGPFSGRQLTTIIVAVVFAVFVPGTVWAVATFSNVAIQDPATGARASVDAQSRLKTLDTISGNVVATPTQPANLVHFFGPPGTNGTCKAMYTVPAGKALILLSATAYMSPDTGASSASLILWANAACTDPISAFTTGDATDTVTVPFGAGRAVSAGAIVSASFLAAGGSGSMSAYGYLVPASSVPAAARAAPLRLRAGAGSALTGR